MENTTLYRCTTPKETPNPDHVQSYEKRILDVTIRSPEIEQRDARHGHFDGSGTCNEITSFNVAVGTGNVPTTTPMTTGHFPFTTFVFAPYLVTEALLTAVRLKGGGVSVIKRQPAI